jgi:hypothetical protein
MSAQQEPARDDTADRLSDAAIAIYRKYGFRGVYVIAHGHAGYLLHTASHNIVFHSAAELEGFLVRFEQLMGGGPS